MRLNVIFLSEHFVTKNKKERIAPSIDLFLPECKYRHRQTPRELSGRWFADFQKVREGERGKEREVSE